MDKEEEAAPNAFAALSAMGDALIRAAAKMRLTWPEVCAGAVAEYNRRMEEINRP